MGLAHGWTWEDAGAQLQVQVSPGKRPRRNAGAGGRADPLLFPPQRWCAASTAWSRPGGLQTLGGLEALSKPPLTPSHTAARQPHELTPISTPAVAKRNAFHNPVGCEVHSCSILLALLT